MFDDNRNYYGKLKTRVKQVLPNHFAEIRLNHLDTHAMFEHSSVSLFNFKNGIVKKKHRCMESQNNQVIIGYDFFKKLHEENAKEKFLTTTPFASVDELITHATITLSMKPRSGMITNNNE